MEKLRPYAVKESEIAILELTGKEAICDRAKKLPPSRGNFKISFFSHFDKLE